MRTFDANASSDFKYTNSAYPPNVSDENILTVTYYDNYDCITAGVFGSQFQCNTGELISDYNGGNTYFESVKGHVTGTVSRVLGDDFYLDKWLKSVSYYDDHYRVIQSIKAAYPVSSANYTIANSKYDFTGKVVKATMKQSLEGTITNMAYSYVYDHAGRLRETYLALNNADSVLISQLNYNQIGELAEKNLHCENHTSFLQSVDYKYNSRGWLTQINDPGNLSQESDFFGMKLFYNTEDPDINNSGLYNGNISGVKWNNASTNYIQGYTFDYDQVNRLSKGDYSYSLNSTWHNNSSFDVDTLKYDMNGNILHLERNDDKGTKLDSLDYVYNGNQLTKVTDGGTDGGFFDNANQAQEYFYDANGNLSKDLNKEIDTIIYNYLNLPEMIISGEDTISYTYDATGTKLKVQYKENSSSVLKKKYYNDIFVYSQDDASPLGLDYVLFDEGLINMKNQTPEYEYFLKDHLGNTRVVINNNAQLVEQHDYYPFGLEFAGRQGGAIKYRYNGKELQDMKIGGRGLDWYDYGARFYDPALGRWHSIDPMAEKYYLFSPYNYTMSDPINLVDPNGMWASALGDDLPDAWQTLDKVLAKKERKKALNEFLKKKIDDASKFKKDIMLDNVAISDDNDQKGSGTSDDDTGDRGDNGEGSAGSNNKTDNDKSSPAANSGGKPWHYTSDYTENGLVLSQSNGRYSYGAWQEDKTGTFLAGAGSGMAIWYLTSGWGLTAAGEALIAGTSGGLGLTNLRYETRRVGYIVDQTTWYGTITHNVFTGNIVGVNNTGLVTNRVNLPNYGMYQERVIFTPTNTVIGTRSKSFGSWQGFSQPAPSVGGDLYGW